MRNLRTTLLRDFYTVGQLQGNAQLFNDNRQQLDILLRGMHGEYTAGNIAQRELLRIQALQRRKQ